MVRFTRPRASLLGLLGAALALDLVVLREQIVLAIAKAVCIERARYELISCVDPPTEVSVAAALALAVGLSVLIGRELGSARR